ncbi:Chromosome partition protein Smc [Maioricimonas rarisocia]|uniref:Chromosome partition protein Smc n=1 Tax=Maioricimonas rarisocia TaxID=2528026 RepID=A0A517ZD77_9PLAN|nr:FHA domain-containing protein [Maioricimonas rarisocia]QDU40444.1 Chromosome partition protein Smc [Maioricimonas rarisocia]
MSTHSTGTSSVSESVLMLVVEQPGGLQTSRQVRADETLIVGNGPSCGLQLHGAGIDSLHCMISLQGDRVRIYDWNSSGGTRVNGRRIEGEELIAAGDVIEIADIRVRTSIVADRSEEPSNDAERQEESASAATNVGSPPAASRPAPQKKAADETIDSVADLDDAEAMLVSSTADLGDGRPSEPDESAYAPLDVLDEFLDGAAEVVSNTPAYALDPELHDDTIELLKSEIAFLQTELAERDAAIRQYELLVEAPLDDESVAATDPEVDVEALVTRLEELLDELARSDERLSAMSELLRAAEDANEAEVEQRNQIEAWVGEIERRFQERDAEWQAERESLQKRLAEVAAQRDRLEQQLGQSGGGGADQKLEAHLKKLRQENTQLRGALEETRNEARSLTERLDQMDAGEVEARQQNAIEEALREERLQLAQERAAITRERAELARLEEQLQRDRDSMGAEGNAADQRIRAFREHLRELHESEPSRPKNTGLSSRLGKLWRKLEGRPLDTD